MNHRQYKFEDEWSLLDQIPSMIFQSDVNSRFIFANQFSKKLWGFNHKDIVGHAYDDMKCDGAELAQNFRNEDLLVMQRRRPLKLISFVKYVDNEFHVVFGEKNPFFMDGQIAGIVGNYTDVTHDKSLRSLILMFLHDKKIVSQKSSSQFTYIVDENFDDFSLTPRQMEVLFYLMRGNTSREIGQKLFISKRTVESHIVHMKLALECDTKSELIEKAIYLGLVQYIPNSIFHN